MDNLNPRPPSSDQQIEAMVDEIARRRARLELSLKQLGSRIRTVTHWRQWIREYPFLSLTFAVSLGMLFGRGTWSRGNKRGS